MRLGFVVVMVLVTFARCAKTAIATACFEGCFMLLGFKINLVIADHLRGSSRKYDEHSRQIPEQHYVLVITDQNSKQD